MSVDDVTVTDRDRAAARRLPIGCECNCKYNVRCHHDEIALALAQARREGSQQGQDQIAEMLDTAKKNEGLKVERLEKCLQEQHEATDALWNERHALQQRADAAEEALRVAREAMDGINHCLEFMSTGADNVLANMVPKINKLNATLTAPPTTASTKTAQEAPQPCQWEPFTLGKEGQEWCPICTAIRNATSDRRLCSGRPKIRPREEAPAND